MPPAIRDVYFTQLIRRCQQPVSLRIVVVFLSRSLSRSNVREIFVSQINFVKLSTVMSHTRLGASPNQHYNLILISTFSPTFLNYTTERQTFFLFCFCFCTLKAKLNLLSHSCECNLVFPGEFSFQD